MGTTLDNGTYLPDEGERNCYEGLAGNWVALDNHLGSTNIHVTINDKQAWNGHVADTTIHVTSADKQAWDGHVADTTIHVTSADKQAWNGHVADSVKHVTAEDKNKWDAVTSKADDSDVVHKSGNETVGGIKTFSDNTYITSLNFTNKVPSPSSSSSSILPIITTITYGDSSPSVQARLNLRITADGVKSLYPHENNQYALGLTNRKWSEVHSATYYYGSSDTEFSDKFATVDTSQTISGEKQFTSALKVNRYIWFNNPSVVKGTVPSTDINPYRMYFGSNLSYESTLFNIDTQVRANGVQRFTLRCAENVVGGNDTRFIIVYNPNDAKPQYFYFMGDVKPYSNNTYGLGDSNFKWSTINGLNPSSLGMPDLSNGIDISSYITHLDKVVNNYTPPSNGWLSIRLKKTSLTHASLMMYQTGGLLSSCETTEFGISGTNLPVIANKKVEIYIIADVLVGAKFYPCQGNV